MPRPASTFRSATSPLRRLVAAGAVGLACGLGATPAAAVIILGSAAGNTEAPTDPGLATRWGQVGNFSDFLGTPIASQFFLTAKHLGNLTGQAITFPDATSYTTTAAFFDPASDLVLYQISGAFPTDKIVPMYSGSFATNQGMTIFGRGRLRTDTQVIGQRFPNGTEAKGWTWGAFTSNRSWGTNTLDGLANGGAAGTQLAWDFDVGGSANEGILATNDSGGPVFMQEGGVWKLAGINYAVGPKDVRETQSGPTLEAAVYDYGGLYVDVSGTWTLQSAAGGDKPAISYSSSVPANATWVQNVVTVPEPATIALLGTAGLASWGSLRRRQRLLRRGAPA
jgi:hypothetical protein